MRKIIALSCIILLSCVFDCRAEGLGTLIELGKSQAEIQKQYAHETKAFEAVKRAIDVDAIKKGESKNSVRVKYGEPIVIVNNLDGKHEDWIYKPAGSSFFRGIRATLVFNAEGVLDEARLEER